MLQNKTSPLERFAKWRKYKSSNYVFLAVVLVFSGVYTLDYLTSKSGEVVTEEIILPYLQAIRDGNYATAYEEYTSDRFKSRYSYQDFVSAYQERTNDLGEMRYFLIDEIVDDGQINAKLQCVFRYGYSGDIELQVRREWGKYYIDDTFEKTGNMMQRRAW